MRTTLSVIAAVSLLLIETAYSAEQSLLRLAQGSDQSTPQAAPAPPPPTAAPAPTTAPPTAAPATPDTPATAAPTAPAASAPAAPAPAALSPAPAARLVGIAAWNALIGNSITGSDDGKPLTEYYAPDGTAKSMSGNEISQGTWALAGEIVCFKYSDEPTPECYKIEVVGDTLTYFDEKGSGTRFKILKGNPSNL